MTPYFCHCGLAPQSMPGRQERVQVDQLLRLDSMTNEKRMLSYSHDIAAEADNSIINAALWGKVKYRVQFWALEVLSLPDHISVLAIQ